MADVLLESGSRLLLEDGSSRLLAESGPGGTAFGATDPLAATLVMMVQPDATLAVTSPGSASVLSAWPDPSLARTSPESATRLPTWQF